MTSFEEGVTELLRELTGRSDADWRDGQLGAKPIEDPSELADIFDVRSPSEQMSLEL